MDQIQEMTTAVKVKTFEFPVQMEALKEVLPKETLGRPDNPKFKLTPLSTAKVLNQDSILASHWLNLPLKEGAIFVPYMYQQIRAVVDKYQLEHEDAFYEQYSELLILKTSESMPTTSELRRNHRKYDRRLAHKIWHYSNASYMYAGALANLCILANVNGTGKFKSFGLACRISAINTASNRFGSFPKMKGCLARISEYSRFAVGKTSYGSTFVSIPMWVTDIFGNRGQHNFGISHLYATEAESGDNIYQIDVNASDTQFAEKALVNAYNVLKMYGYDTVDPTGKHSSYIGKTLDSSGKKNVVPSCPHIENGSTINVRDSNGTSVMMPTNKDGNDMYNGFTYVKKPDGASGSLSTDNIISRAWDTFNFWQAYMEYYFHEFAEYDSQVRRFFCDVIQVLEPSLDTQKFFASINTSHFFDAADLRNQMIYKRDNAVNTATIIKWAPLIDHDGSEWIGSSFDDNFNRYPVDEMSEPDYLRESELWPRLTPTSFTDVDGDTTGVSKPYVFNAAVTPGCTYDGGLFSDTNKEYFGAKAPVGRYATMLDQASCASVDAKDTAIDVLAIDPDQAKDFVKRNNGIVFKARPTAVLTYEQPLFDNSDPYQCGFNVIISNDAETADEFSQWYQNTLNYIQDSSDTNPPDITLPPANWGDGSVGDEFYPTNPSCAKMEVSGTDYMIKAHAMSEYYLTIKKHLLIFIGDNIFTHPAVAGGKLSAGNPAERFYLSDGTAAGVSFFQGIKTVNQGLTDNDLEDDSVSVFADAAVMSIMHSMEMHLFGDGQMTEFRSARELFTRAIDNLQTVVANVVNQFQQFIFDPAYGPVSPVVYDMPPIGFSAWAPLPYDNDIQQSYTPEDNAAPLTPMVAYKNQGSTDAVDYIPELADIPPRWKPIETSALFWLWFVDSFRFMKTKMQGSSPIIYPDPIKIAGCSSFAKALLTMISRSTVFFTGVEDTLPLYSIPEDRMKSKDPNVAASGDIKFSALVMTPRVVAVRNKSQGGSDTSRAPRSVSTEQSEAVDRNPSMKQGGSPDGRGVKEDAKKHKSRRPRKNKRSADDRASNKESMYDDSTKPEDDKLEKAVADKEFDSVIRTQQS